MAQAERDSTTRRRFLQLAAASSALTGTMAGASADASADADLFKLIDDFKAASIEEDRMIEIYGEHQQRHFDSRSGPFAKEPRSLRRVERLYHAAMDRACEIADEIAETEARTLAGVIAKARIADEREEVDPLTQSVIEDLLAVAGAAGAAEAI